MRASTLLFLVLFACDDKGTIELDDTDADDSAVEGDSDADSDSDTDTDSDADTDITLLTFDIDGDHAGTAMDLTWFAPGNETLILGDTLVSAEVTANPFGLEAPAPAIDQLMELDPANAPGFYAALYLAALHEDTDGDHTHDDEPYLGVSAVWLLYADGTIPDYYLQLGIRHGWNGLLPDLENNGPPTVLSLDALPIATNLSPTDSISISGAYAGDVDVSTVRFALLPYVIFEGQNPGSLLYDEAMSASWEISVSGAPPSAHIVNGGELDGVALEVPLTYTDTDNSGGFSGGDLPLYPACLDSLTVALWYYPQPTELVSAALASWYGFSTGWAAFTVDDSDNFSFLSAEQRTMLSVSAACSL